MTLTFRSILSTIGADAKSVFAWIGSAKGQSVLGAGEAVVESVVPQLDGLITIANTYIAEAVKVETLAAAAGVQNGSGVQKLAAVTTAVTPTVLAYAQKAGLPTPTADEISAAANGIVAFLNALNGGATSTA